MSSVYKSNIGLEVYRDYYDGVVHYSITGNVSSKHTVKEFESAYDFEDFIRKNVACKTIDFDSEFCQFWAYAKTKQQAVAFVKRVEKFLNKVKETFE